jgi:predicted nucleic acid-binding protein
VSFVLDASAALTWGFADERDTASEALRSRAVEEAVLVPSVFPLEIANGLWAAERRRRIDSERMVWFIELLGTMPIVVDATTHERALSDILALARRELLTSYDAAYLDLALREGLPLATRDSTLAAAARRAGVDVIEG